MFIVSITIDWWWFDAALLSLRVACPTTSEATGALIAIWICNQRLSDSGIWQQPRLIVAGSV